MLTGDLNSPYPQCGDPNGNERDYNIPFHIGALFIIFGFSFFSCAFPILAIRFTRLRIPPNVLFVARHFGTGVLLATGFVHLLPTAFVSLLDPCLGPFFTEKFPALAGAISLASTFLVTIVEMIFSPGQHCCSGPGMEQVPVSATQGAAIVSSRDEGDAPSVVVDRDQVTTNFGMIGPHGSNSNSTAHRLGRLASGIREKEPSSPDTEIQQLDPEKISFELEQARKRGLLQCMLLEMGILFHSIFIGIAISVAIGKEFVVLLIAISFHRKSQPFQRNIATSE
jgi:zinc transporter ZupT